MNQYIVIYANGNVATSKNPDLKPGELERVPIEEYLKRPDVDPRVLSSIGATPSLKKYVKKKQDPELNELSNRAARGSGENTTANPITMQGIMRGVAPGITRALYEPDSRSLGGHIAGMTLDAGAWSAPMIGPFAKGVGFGVKQVPKVAGRAIKELGHSGTISHQAARTGSKAVGDLYGRGLSFAGKHHGLTNSVGTGIEAAGWGGMYALDDAMFNEENEFGWEGVALGTGVGALMGRWNRFGPTKKFEVASDMLRQLQVGLPGEQLARVNMDVGPMAAWLSKQNTGTVFNSLSDKFGNNRVIAVWDGIMRKERARVKQIADNFAIETPALAEQLNDMMSNVELYNMRQFMLENNIDAIADIPLSDAINLLGSSFEIGPNNSIVVTFNPDLARQRFIDITGGPEPRMSDPDSEIFRAAERRRQQAAEQFEAIMSEPGHAQRMLGNETAAGATHSNRVSAANEAYKKTASNKTTDMDRKKITDIGIINSASFANERDALMRIKESGVPPEGYTMKDIDRMISLAQNEAEAAKASAAIGSKRIYDEDMNLTKYGDRAKDLSSIFRNVGNIKPVAGAQLGRHVLPDVIDLGLEGYDYLSTETPFVNTFLPTRPFAGDNKLTISPRNKEQIKRGERRKSETVGDR